MSGLLNLRFHTTTRRAHPVLGVVFWGVLGAGCAAEALDEAPDAGASALDAGALDAASTSDAGSVDAGPARILALDLEPPGPWAAPIEDYLEAGRSRGRPFMEAIHDLAVYQGRLYIGYGDATENLGRVIPIEFRSFGASTATTARRELASDEEQLDRYRRIDGDLYVAGVDATEDAFLGNVYARTATSSWVKRRTVLGGVHVHDVAGFDGAIYAVGSGVDGIQEWNAGRIFAYLWRTTDRGASFEVVARTPNGGRGDTRYVRLLSLPPRLYLFGYATNSVGTIDEIRNRIFDGQDLYDLPRDHPLRFVLVTETDAMPDGVALVRGVDASRAELRAGAWRVTTDGQVAPVTALAGETIVDASLHPETGELVVLTVDGDAWGVPPPPGARNHVYVTTDLERFDRRLSFEPQTALRSIAFWAGSLYYGTQDGRVWR